MYVYKLDAIFFCNRVVCIVIIKWSVVILIILFFVKIIKYKLGFICECNFKKWGL